MKDILNEIEEKKYQFIEKYTNKFTNNELIKYENKIFGQLTNKQKIIIEYQRLKKYLQNNPSIYVNYLETILEIEKLLKLLKFDETLEEKICKKIVTIQIETEQSVRMLGTISKIKEEIEYLKFYKEKTTNSTIKK